MDMHMGIHNVRGFLEIHVNGYACGFWDQGRLLTYRPVEGQ